jgi:hypothetical protein
MTGSTVPPVLAALNAMFVTATGATVILGEPQQGQPGDFIALAHNEQADGVSNLQSIMDYGLRAALEEYDVNSVISCWQGNGDLAATLDRAYGFYDQIGAALVADPRLGEACMLAQLTTSSLRPMQTTNGAMTVLPFTVHVKAQRS